MKQIVLLNSTDERCSCAQIKSYVKWEDNCRKKKNDYN